MAVLKGYVRSMAKPRADYLKKWESLKNTILRHIAKILLVVDDYSLNDWCHEIDTYADTLASYETKSKVSDDTYFDEIYDGYKLENQMGVKGVVENAIKDYCCDPKNKTNTARVREWESRLKEVEASINTIFLVLVTAIRDAKELKGGSYDYGSIRDHKDTKSAVATNYAIKQYKVWHCVNRRQLTIKYAGTL